MMRTHRGDTPAVVGGELLRNKLFGNRFRKGYE